KLAAVAIVLILAALVAFGLAPATGAAPTRARPQPRPLPSSIGLRGALIAAICVIQGASSFFAVANTDIRPLQRPDVLSSMSAQLRVLRALPAYQRIYLYGDYGAPLGWLLKPGLLNGFSVAIDYESLIDRRYGAFFDFISPVPHLFGERFEGFYPLNGKSNW